MKLSNTLFVNHSRTKKKKCLSFYLLLFTIYTSKLIAQNGVGINTTSPQAALDVTSTSSGILIPRMTSLQKIAIASPPTGSLVYQTDATTGFYYYDGSVWKPLLNTTTGWNTTGNAGTTAGTNFIGTTDAQDFVVSTNGSERLRVLSTGNVGIGNTSPANPLQVSGTATIGVKYNSTAHAYMQVDGAVTSQSGYYIAKAGAQKWGMYTDASSNDLKFYDNAGDRVTFQQGGNVGIGTTTPSAILDVYRATGVSLLSDAIRVHRPGSFGQYAFMAYAQASGDAYFGSVYTGAAGTYGQMYFRQYTQGGVFRDAMFVRTDGNVGIGTTTPLSKLSIEDNTTTLNQFSTYSTNATPTVRTYSTADGFGLLLNSYLAVNGIPYTRYTDFVASTGDVSSSMMRFFTKPYSANPVANMVIDKDGNVGVGTSSPTTKLNVVGAGYVESAVVTERTSADIAGPWFSMLKSRGGLSANTGDNLGRLGFRFRNSLNNEFVGASISAWTDGVTAGAESAYLTFEIANSGVSTIEQMRLTSSGNLGVGTSSPVHRLGIQCNGSSTRALSIYYGGGAGDYGAIGFQYSPNNALASSEIRNYNPTANADADLAFWLANGSGTLTEYLRIKGNTGNVGIGTTNPGVNLEVKNRLRLYDGTASHYGIIDLGLADVILKNNPLGTAAIGDFQITNWSGSAYNIGLFLKGSNGNVGIGTTAPAQALDVVGNGNFSGSVFASCGTLTCSDIRYKKDITPLTNSLTNIMKLQGVTYNWKREEFKEKNFTDKLQIGVIAQDLEKVYPELVHTDEKGFKTVDYAKLTPILIEAIKELKNENNTVNKKYDNLKSENDLLKNRLDKIEALLPILNEPLQTKK